MRADHLQTNETLPSLRLQQSRRVLPLRPQKRLQQGLTQPEVPHSRKHGSLFHLRPSQVTKRH